MNPLLSSGESLSHLSHRALVPCVSGLQKAPYARLRVSSINHRNPTGTSPCQMPLFSQLSLSLPQSFLNRLLFHIRPTAGLQRGLCTPLSSTQASQQQDRPLAARCIILYIMASSPDLPPYRPSPF